MHLFWEFWLVFGLAVFFLWQVENLGFLIRLIIYKLASKLNLKISFNQNVFSDYFFNIFLGLLIFGMTFFWVGVLHLLSPNLVLLGTFLAAVSIFFKFKRWKNFDLKVLSNWIIENKFILIGCSIFTILVLPHTFRPIVSFDALWYHLSIPKLFLQEGNINYLGTHTRYSVHPYLNFFWNFWPLSLPLSIPLQTMVVNFIQTLVFVIGLFLSMQFAQNLFAWSKLALIVGPTLIGLNLATVLWFGAGYNDLYGMILGLVLVLFVYYLSQKNKIYFDEFVLTGLFLSLVFLIKVFFAIFACIVFVYFVLTSLSKLDFLQVKDLKQSNFWTLKNLKIFTLTIVSILVFFIIPWLVRSYLHTDRLLDPIGAPGMSEDVFWYAGSMNAQNHWTRFVWVRLYQNLGQIMFAQYGLLFVIGLFALINKFFWEKYKELWAVGVIGFWGVFLISVVMEFRYFLPGAALLSFLGLTLINSLKHFPKNWIVGFLSILFVINIIGVGYSVFYKSVDKMYIWANQSYDNFLEVNLSGDIFSYYPSANSPKPPNLSYTDKIFVFNLQQIAYIPNPLITISSHPEIFDSITSTQDLANRLQAHNIKYILLKTHKFNFVTKSFEENSVNDICQRLGIKDDPECQEESQFWTVETRDEKQQIIWLRIKYE